VLHLLVHCMIKEVHDVNSTMMATICGLGRRLRNAVVPPP
jgi:hypothetical protein